MKNTLRYQDRAIELDGNDSLENAQKYACTAFENTYFLGYRDIPFLLKKYVHGKKAIDYGCGTGRSTRFLQSQGFETIGVDVSKAMLEQASAIDAKTRYIQIENAQIPVFKNSCDLVFSCFVLFVVPSKEELFAIFKEVYRSLRSGGIFIAVTGSEELYSHEWLSYNVNYSQNKHLKSGNITKIQLKDLEVEFTNYFWTDDDYMGLFQQTNFKLLEKHFPLGKKGEKQKWAAEMEHPPYVIYVIQKPR